jgi:hypothetical protein
LPFSSDTTIKNQHFEKVVSAIIWGDKDKTILYSPNIIEKDEQNP